MQNIEDDKSLDFQTELLMLLSQESNIEDNLCLISNLPLEENHVKLCCGHKFNYASIFNEVMKLSDKILVLYNGKVNGVISRAKADKEYIGQLMAGLDERKEGAVL